MTNNDTLAACLSKINNAEKVSKNEIVIYGISNTIKEILKLFVKNGYLGKISYEENKKGGKIIVELLNQINKCGSIKPRFKVKVNEIEKYEKRYLPAKDFGLLIVSTSKGMITNSEAKERNLGGRLIAFCY